MAFEVVGNSMYDGTIESIPNDSLVLGRSIDIDDFISKYTGNALGNKTFIIINKARIICKRITRYNEKKSSVTCTSLNDSPEYKDFDLPLAEITRLYEVVKKQI